NYGMLPSLPYTPGSDAAGTVKAVGSDVRAFAPGARVYIAGTAEGRAYGAYADTALCGVDQIHHLPDGVSFAQGPGLAIPFVTAWRALFDKGAAQPGQTVLIHGASGAVGGAAVQMARAAGLRVLGTAGTDRGRALARKLGAHEIFDHTSSDY